MQEQKPALSADEQKKRRLNILRFGLMAIPPIAWAVAFAPLFMLTYSTELDWITSALIPSLIEAIIVGVVCFVIWYLYKRFALKA
jgi:uncharacterized membrane protein